MNTINVENCKTLLIGRRGENEVTTVAFDFTEWQTEFGSGVVDLYVKRFGDNSAYPVVLTVDGAVASWLVTETDTNVAGYGKAEYVYRVDGKIAKSAVFSFFVAEDIGQPASEPPDPYESWLEQLTALGAETEAHAQAAERSAENAAESAEDAAESATNAEDYAGQAEAAKTAAQTASEAARDAAEDAQQAAQQAHVEYEQLSGEVDDLSDEVAQQKSAIEDISYEKSNYKNYFDFSQESLIQHTYDTVVSYSGTNVNLSFTETANPIMVFKVPNLFPDKSYRLKFTISNGALNKTYCLVRKYLASDPKSGRVIASMSFTDNVCDTLFTVPAGENCVTLAFSLIYSSKNVTLSNMSVEPANVESTRVIKESAENTNVVQMSFIYSTVTGDCTIMKIQGDVSDKVMMIDTMADNNTVAKTNITAALNNYEITHIDYLMISHYHSDHIGNIQWLVDNGYIDGDTVFILPEDVDDTSAGLIRDDNPDKAVVQHCADVLAIITSLDAEKVYPDENEVISINGCDFVFWNTDHTEYYARTFVDYNECSLCCTMVYGEMVVQFTGDIGTIACGKYFDKLYKCNIFKANHHACGYAVVPRFMSAVFPEIVVTMAGSSVIYSTDPAVQAVFATLSTGLQAWCETEFVPNYVTGVIKDNIYLTVDKGSFKFDSAARRCVRADEGIPVSS